MTDPVKIVGDDRRRAPAAASGVTALSSPTAMEPASGLHPDGLQSAGAEDALRSLASFVGAGGYNAATVDPDVFEDKIRWGINHLINATIQRCADVIEEQSKNYAHATWGTAKRAILDLKSPEDSDATFEHQDWRIGQMHVELEHLVTSVKGGELYCELCKSLVGEDGTLQPASCPLSYGYDHIRAASVGRNAKRHDPAEGRGPEDEHAVGAAETPNSPSDHPGERA